jgi:hypothetical protein
MGPTSDQSERNRAQSALNLTLAAVAGQVGCLTSIIVLAALLGGLWLDNRFDSRPMFTVGLIITSVPVTLVAMIWVVRTATSRIKSGTQQDSKIPMEEELTSE